MRIWHQLRWRIVGAQMLVVVVGVVTLTVTADVLATRSVSPALQPAFHDAVLRSLVVAAVAATTAGLASSLLLARAILRPLGAITASSRRIADGRYDQRVATPDSAELQAVALSFNQMAQNLEQVERQRVAMIGNVAHELRTPLAGLEGYLEGLQDGIVPSSPATFGDMRHEVRRLRRLVDDLQALSRVEAGQEQLRFSRFDLRDIARRVVGQLRPQVMDGCLQLEGDDDAPAMVFADPDRVAQILVNLVGNAIRYTPPEGCITVRLIANPDTVRVVVHDTGIGIPAETLPYVFERFYRVDPSRARSSGGSGIGLTISLHLAWAMGGDITAASDGPGQGSTFTLSLPLAAAGQQG
ncbi:HAMP domain-containing protein [Oscillochloris sp. ZM17-4]|uniref:sensor histidine kinase n=1 Tax=Oscillochloris sp. ZM17-4 TaxID=2866714 RepID=UPI001C72CBDA|nr:ATP-binding protein [Oscillochloris sp. ZM17-4]MBX0330902.1 HAMP domain-containing protein [Oscillochloris sp. ZM17-4]